VTLNRILTETLGENDAQKLQRAQVAKEKLIKHFPTESALIPETTSDALKPAGDVRNFLHKNYAQFGEEVKTVLQELLVYQSLLTSLPSTTAILDCLGKFPGNVEPDTYLACVQGLKERLEAVLCTMSPLSPLNNLLVQAYDEAMMATIRKYYRLDDPRLTKEQKRRINIDVHAATIFGWMSGVRELGHATYTTHLYDGKGNKAFKLDIYRNLHLLMQKKIGMTRQEGVKELREFFATHPTMEKGEISFYGSDGRRYYQKGAYYETEIDGKMVRVCKDEGKGGGYCYKKEDGKLEYLTAQINGANRALEELLKKLSLIGPSAEFGPAQANEAGLLTADFTEWKPHAAEIAIMHFLPDVRIVQPWENYGKEGETSIMAQTHEVHLVEESPHSKILISKALRSENPQEQIAAIHALYVLYICTPGHTHRVETAAENLGLRQLFLSLGYGLLSEIERSDHLYNNKAGTTQIVLRKARNFITDLLARNEAGIPDFMRREVLGVAAIIESDRSPFGINLESGDTLRRMREAFVVMALSNDWKSLQKTLSEISLETAEVKRIARAARAAFENRQREKIIEAYTALRNASVIPQEVNRAILSVSTRSIPGSITSPLAKEEEYFTRYSLLAWVFANERELLSDYEVENRLPSCVDFLLRNRLSKSLLFLLLHGPKKEQEEIMVGLDANKETRDSVTYGALADGNIEAIKRLISHDNFNSKISAFGFTPTHPLSIASSTRNPHSVAFLVELANGLTNEIEKAEARDATNLSFAREVDNKEITTALLKSTNIDLGICFEVALKKGDSELAQDVLAKIESPTIELLEMAVRNHNPILVERLLENGLNPYLTNGEKSAFDLAIDSKDPRSLCIIEVLLRAQEDDFDFDPENRLNNVYALLEKLITEGNRGAETIDKVEKLLTAAKRAKIEMDEGRLIEIFNKGPELFRDHEMPISVFFDDKEKVLELRSLKLFEDGLKTEAREVEKEIILGNVPAFLHAALTAKAGKSAEVTDSLFFHIISTVLVDFMSKEEGAEEERDKNGKEAIIAHLGTAFKGWPALHYAISQGVNAKTILTLLKEYQQDPNFRILITGQNALQVALDFAIKQQSSGSLNLLTIENLVFHGPTIDCNTKSADGLVPLYQLIKLQSNTEEEASKAALQNFIEHLVLRHKASYELAFEVALQKKDNNAAGIILQFARLDQHQISRMFKAALEQDNTTIAKNILSRGLISREQLNQLASEAYSESGETLLAGLIRKCATKPDFDSVILEMLSRGANPFQRNSQRTSPLHLALTIVPESGRIQVAERIVQMAESCGISQDALGAYCIKTIDRIIEDASLTSQQREQALLKLNQVIANKIPELLPKLAARYICELDYRVTLHNPAIPTDDVLRKMSPDQKTIFFSGVCKTPYSITEYDGRIIERNNDVARGRPALYHCISRLNTDLMDVLLRNGAPLITTRDSKGNTYTPLAYAALDLHNAPLQYLIAEEKYLTEDDKRKLDPTDAEVRESIFYQVVISSIIFQNPPEEPSPALFTLANYPTVQKHISRYYAAFLEDLATARSEDVIENSLKCCQTLNTILLKGITHDQLRYSLIGECCVNAITKSRPELAVPLLAAIDDEKIKREVIYRSFCAALLKYDKESCQIIIDAIDLLDVQTKRDLITIAHIDVGGSTVPGEIKDRAESLISELLGDENIAKKLLTETKGAAAVLGQPGVSPQPGGAGAAVGGAGAAAGGRQ
jgi:ankyrin repeat protein